MLASDTAFGVSDALERAEVAAAEDGRTPVNRYSAAGRWAGGTVAIRGFRSGETKARRALSNTRPEGR